MLSSLPRMFTRCTTASASSNKMSTICPTKAVAWVTLWGVPDMRLCIRAGSFSTFWL